MQNNDKKKEVQLDPRVDGLTSRVDTLVTDVTTLKIDVSVLKADVSVLKADVVKLAVSPSPRSASAPTPVRSAAPR